MNSQSVQSDRQEVLQRRGGELGWCEFIFPSGGMFEDVTSSLKTCSSGVLWENILLPYAEG